MFESILCQVTEYEPDVLESLIELAVEIAQRGVKVGASAPSSPWETRKQFYQGPDA